MHFNVIIFTFNINFELIFTPQGSVENPDWFKPFYYDLSEVENCWIFVHLQVFILALDIKRLCMPKCYI